MLSILCARRVVHILNDSQTETLRQFQKGESVDQIVRARGLVASTIYGHLLAAIERGKIVEQGSLLNLGARKGNRCGVPADQ